MTYNFKKKLKMFCCNKKSKIEKKTIGVMGTVQGVGTTYTSLLIGIHFSQILGKKTALLEMNQKNDFYELQLVLDEQDESKKEFQFGNLYFYRQVQEGQMGEIMNHDFDCIILDFGSHYKKYKNEFLKCNQKLVLCSLTIWKQKYLMDFMTEYEDVQEGKGWNYLAIFGQKKLYSFCNSKHIKFKSIPFVKDPFCLNLEIERVFEILF